MLTFFSHFKNKKNMKTVFTFIAIVLIAFSFSGCKSQTEIQTDDLKSIIRSGSAYQNTEFVATSIDNKLYSGFYWYDCTSVSLNITKSNGVGFSFPYTLVKKSGYATLINDFNFSYSDFTKSGNSYTSDWKYIETDREVSMTIIDYSSYIKVVYNEVNHFGKYNIKTRMTFQSK